VAAEAEAPELARRLLDGVAGGRPGVAEQASGFGLELGEPFRVGVARTSAGNDTEPLADLLATGGIHLVATRAGEVAFLAQDTDALGALAGALAGLCGAVGLGRAVRSVGNATSSYHQARRAAALAVEMDVPVVRYDDTGIFEVLAGGASPSLMEAFVAEWLGPLVIHDRSKRGDLTVTLAGYLGAGANQSAAAGALGLHVSTLKYRLARMAEVTGRDLSSPEVRFHLQAALHMRRTLNVLAAEGSAPSHPPIS
ncbi:MAG: PucR family transcriptional regulator, partial [Acidimicrobiia bacterium]